MRHELKPGFDYNSIPEAHAIERVERMRLKPGDLTEVDATHVIADADFVRNEIGVDGALVASVRAGKTDYLLIDTRKSTNTLCRF